MIAKLLQGGEREVLRERGVAVLLEEKGLPLLEKVMDGGVERVEVFVQAQGVELLAAFLDGLGDGGADAAAFVAQQGEEADGGAAQFRAGCRERRRR